MGEQSAVVRGLCKVRGRVGMRGAGIEWGGGA